MHFQYCLMPSSESNKVLNGLNAQFIDTEEDLLEIFKEQDELRKEKFPGAVFNFRLVFYEPEDENKANSWVKRLLKEKDTYGNLSWAQIVK